jgi:hypothetical protein
MMGNLAGLVQAFQAVAAAGTLAGQPDATFRALEAATRAAIGHRLFTVMRHDPAAGRNRRVFTSDPAAYPVSGYKPVDWAHPWAQRVLLRGEPWIGRSAADIAWAYPDHERIAAMGLASAMNLPVRWNGAVLGTVNLLDAEGHFAEESAVRGMLLAALAVPAMLAIDGL